MRRYDKSIYHGKGFTTGLLVEFAAVAGLMLVGFIICLIMVGW